MAKRSQGPTRTQILEAINAEADPAVLEVIRQVTVERLHALALKLANAHLLRRKMASQDAADQPRSGSKRRFTAAHPSVRCVASITLRDGSRAQCMRHRVYADLCVQHHRIAQAEVGHG